MTRLKMHGLKFLSANYHCIVCPAENDLKAQKEFDNWNSKRGMTVEAAKLAYVALVTKLVRDGGLLYDPPI
jgi:hypothetical protein